MRFRDALGGPAIPLLYEQLPPKLADGEAGYARIQDRLAALAGYPLAAITIPELGKESCLTAAPRAAPELLGYRVRAQTPFDAVLCRTVYDRTPEEHRAWLRREGERGLRNYVFVGPSARREYRDGLRVDQAAAIAREYPDRTAGAILIPWRNGEAERAQRKVDAGADFFLTQFLFDSDDLFSVLRQLRRTPRVFLSFAPVADERDLRLLVDPEKFRGKISERTASQLLENKTGYRSICNALGLYEEIRQALAREQLDIPLGIHVEAIWERNEALALELLREFATVVGTPASHGEF